jgi:hypothetical protein
MIPSSTTANRLELSVSHIRPARSFPKPLFAGGTGATIKLTGRYE